MDLLRVRSNIPLNELTPVLNKRLDSLDAAIEYALENDVVAEEQASIVSDPIAMAPVVSLEKPTTTSKLIEPQILTAAQVLAAFKTLAQDPRESKLRNSAVNHALRYYFQLASTVGAIAARQQIEDMFFQATDYNSNQQTTEIRPHLGSLQRAILASINEFDDMLIEDKDGARFPTAVQEYYLKLLSQGNSNPQDQITAIGLYHIYLVVCNESKIFELISEIEQQIKLDDDIRDQETRDITFKLQEIRDLFRINLEGIEVASSDQSAEKQLEVVLDEFAALESELFNKQSDPEQYKISLVLEQLAAALCESLSHPENATFREYFLREFAAEHSDLLTRWLLNPSFAQLDGAIRKAILQKYAILHNDAQSLDSDAPWINSLYDALKFVAQKHINQELERKATNDAFVPLGILHAAASHAEQNRASNSPAGPHDTAKKSVPQPGMSLRF